MSKPKYKVVVIKENVHLTETAVEVTDDCLVAFVRTVAALQPFSKMAQKRILNFVIDHFAEEALEEKR